MTGKFTIGKEKTGKFTIGKENGKWCVIAIAIVDYHIPAIVKECSSRAEAATLAKELHRVISR